MSKSRPKYSPGDLLDTTVAPTLILHVNPFCQNVGWSYDVLKAGTVYNKVNQGNIDFSIKAQNVSMRRYWYDDI